MPRVPSFVRRLPLPGRVETALDTGLDRALAVQQPVVTRYLEHTRRRNPGMTPAQLVAQLERRYRTAVMGIGGASGAAAAVPGTGTAASLASGAAEITAFVSASAMYVLALAEVYGVPTTDLAVRRALVLSVLVGEGGEAIIRGETGAAPHWAQVLGRGTSREQLSGINGRLVQVLIRRWGTRQGVLILGRALPMGLGAGVGAAGNAALARVTIRSARKAFGPPPRTFPPQVVTVD